MGHWVQVLSYGHIGLDGERSNRFDGPMARPLRIEVPGGRYHVTARGNERQRIFRDDADHFHFLELLSQCGERFGAKVHAYVLMDNHYHLLVETPEANLSRAMHWLNAGYCVWFNARHRRHGPLLQGRFGAPEEGDLSLIRFLREEFKKKDPTWGGLEPRNDAKFGRLWAHPKWVAPE